jgi:hypothetical protein
VAAVQRDNTGRFRGNNAGNHTLNNSSFYNLQLHPVERAHSRALSHIGSLQTQANKASGAGKHSASGNIISLQHSFNSVALQVQATQIAGIG